MLCLWCKTEFEQGSRPGKRFCSDPCRVKWNNERKLSGIHLAPPVLHALQGYADAHKIGIDAMVNQMLWRVLNPDGESLSDSDIFGVEEVK